MTIKNLNIDPESIAPFIDNAWVFWKDNNGKYLGCNKIMADTLKFTSPSDILGISDYDLPVKNDEASFYKVQDQTVIRTCLPMQFTDTATCNNLQHNFIVLKMPIVADNKIIGIFGLSSFNKKNDKLFNSDITFNLTAIEQTICYNLLRGKTAKEISVIMFRSFRTIEHHIERIKIKLKVKTKSELISLLFEHMK